jgi:hypothetical protein
MTLRMRSVMVAVVLCVARYAAGQEATGPVAPKPTTAANLEKVLSGLINSGADDRLWDNLTPDARRAFVTDALKLQQEIQAPVGPVTPKPPVNPNPKPDPPPPPAPGRGPAPPTQPPAKADFEKAIEGLRDTIRARTKTDPGFVLPAPVNVGLQRLVEQLSNARR